MLPFLLVHNVLSNAECTKLRTAVDHVVDLDEVDDDDLDQGDGVYARARLRNSALSRKLMKRLQAIPQAQDYLHAAGVECLNLMWFYTRYPIGGDLQPHVDGTCSMGGRTSALTLLVYLNDDFKGGETVFHEPSPTTITPRAGSVLLLKQDVLHEGRPVVRGVKYLLRGDAMMAAMTVTATASE